MEESLELEGGMVGCEREVKGKLGGVLMSGAEGPALFARLCVLGCIGDVEGTRAFAMWGVAFCCLGVCNAPMITSEISPGVEEKAWGPGCCWGTARGSSTLAAIAGFVWRTFSANMASESMI